MDPLLLQQFREQYRPMRSDINPAIHGCSLEDIAEYERAIGLPLPQIYKEVLLLEGRQPADNPLQTMFSFPEIIEANEIAREVAARGEFPDFPPNAVVLYMFEGYQMWYTLSDGSDNPPVYFQNGGDPPKFECSLIDYYLHDPTGSTQNDTLNQAEPTFLQRLVSKFFSSGSNEK